MFNMAEETQELSQEAKSFMSHEMKLELASRTRSYLEDFLSNPLRDTLGVTGTYVLMQKRRLEILGVLQSGNMRTRDIAARLKKIIEDEKIGDNDLIRFEIEAVNATAERTRNALLELGPTPDATSLERISAMNKLYRMGRSGVEKGL